MNTRILSLFGIWIVVLAAAAAAQETPSSSVITGERAGRIRLGMTVAEARKAVAPMKLERTSDGEGIALIALKRGKDTVMTIYAGEEDRDAAIAENAKIEQIWVWDKNYRTSEGISPGMRLAEAEKISGPVKEIVRSEIESREFVEFARQPSGIMFRLYSGDGVFAAGSSTTAKYRPAARILSIEVVGERAPMDGDDDVSFTSTHTDLRSGCTSAGGEEGGHVSTFCKGPAGYQVHFFDAATVYQLNVADERRDFEEPVAMFGLDKLKAAKAVEWRIADGTPFAAIFTHPGNGKVIVRGLKGFERIKLEEEGKGALERARSMADDMYADIIVPATRIDATPTVTVYGKLAKYDDKAKYVVKASAGDHLKVSIKARKWTGEEGPIMVGIVMMPDGSSDGAPGGTVFDDALTQDGDHEILVYQNGAKSRAENIDYEVTISLTPKAN